MNSRKFFYNQTLTAAILMTENKKALIETSGKDVTCWFTNENPLKNCGFSHDIDMNLLNTLSIAFNLTFRFIRASGFGFSGVTTKNQDTVFELLHHNKADISANAMGMTESRMCCLPYSFPAYALKLYFWTQGKKQSKCFFYINNTSFAQDWMKLYSWQWMALFSTFEKVLKETFLERKVAWPWKSNFLYFLIASKVCIIEFDCHKNVNCLP